MLKRKDKDIDLLVSNLETFLRFPCLFKNRFDRVNAKFSVWDHFSNQEHCLCSGWVESFAVNFKSVSSFIRILAFEINSITCSLEYAIKRKKGDCWSRWEIKEEGRRRITEGREGKEKGRASRFTGKRIKEKNEKQWIEPISFFNIHPELEREQLCSFMIDVPFVNLYRISMQDKLEKAIWFLKKFNVIIFFKIFGNLWCFH